jgi:hypothetical protein
MAWRSGVGRTLARFLAGMRRRGLPGVVLLVAATAPVGAQVPLDSLAPGARVRVRAPESGIPWRSIGTLDSATSDSVYLRGLHDPPALRNARLAVPLRHVERMDVSAGRSSRSARARRGAMWGLAAYAVAAGAYIVREKTTCRSDCFGEGFAWLGLVNGIPVAAGIGAGIGFALPVERWRPVILAPR